MAFSILFYIWLYLIRIGSSKDSHKVLIKNIKVELFPFKNSVKVPEPNLNVCDWIFNDLMVPTNCCLSPINEGSI